MKDLPSILLSSLALAGCAAGPNWQRTDIQDKVSVSRQLAIDDGQCTLVSVGAAPMPRPLSTNPQAQNFTVQGSTYNPSAGTWSHSTYTGQITNGSRGGFADGVATGFNAGMTLGATIKAQQQQDAIYAACMNAKGWVDVPAATKMSDVPVLQRTVASSEQKSEEAITNNSAMIAWQRDVEEFLWLFPAYRETEHYKRLDATVRKIAKDDPSLDGKQVLLMAREVLKIEGLEVSTPGTPSHRLAALSYQQAVKGDAKAQLAMSAAHSGNSGEGLGVERAMYWANEAARRGDPVGEILMGLHLFHGNGIEQNKVAGYKLVKKAANVNSDARALLPKLEAAMSASELVEAR